MEYLFLRMGASFLSGVVISLSGSFIQLSTRNILASPSTLGIEGVSVLWILLLHSLVVFFGLPSDLGLYFGIPFFVVLGVFCAKLLGADLKIERVLLIGLSFNLLVGAVFSLWQFVFMAYNLPFPMEVWFGNFRFVEVSHVLLLLSFLFISYLLMGFIRKDLKLYSLGPSIARAHGGKLPKLFSILLGLSFLGTFLVIVSFGAFSFLGLLFPLMARKLWFHRFDLKGELILGPMANGLIFSLLDLACYHFTFMGAEVPVGLVASIMGALCLIQIVVMGRSGDFLANNRK